MSMKKDLYEKIEKLGVLNEADLSQLKEDIQTDDSWVASMYGAPVPKEKNINRVVAGLRAHMGAPSPVGLQSSEPTGGVSLRYVQALEMQIQHLARQVKQLHNQYNRLTKSHNAALDKINELARHTRSE